MRPAFSTLVAAGFASALGGCSSAPPAVVPETVRQLPETFSQAEADGPYRPLAWWEAFDDPVLNRIVALAVERNLDIRQAIARLAQVRARARIERADLLPDLRASAEGRYFNQPADSFGTQAGGTGGTRQPPAAADAPDRIEDDTYTAALRFSYELDFWGRVRNAADAAEQRALAGAADLRSAVLSVIAETIRTYLQLIALEQRLDLARADVDLLGERLELTRQRYASGLVDSFELYGLTEQFRTVEAALPRLESAIFSAQSRLATLTGVHPGSVEDDLASVDPLRVRIPVEPVPPGIPAALLVQRPDVRAGWLRLQAARFTVGEARAAELPRITLTGGVGLEGGSPAGLVDPGNWFASFVAGLTAPIFDAGRLDARTDLAEAQLAEQANAYAQTVLTAMREVETALKDHGESARRYALLLRQLENARASEDLQLRRYRQGVGDYLAWLDSRRNLVGARRAVVEAEQALAEARLSVHRALGGAWIEEDLTVETQDLIAAATGEPAFPPVAAQQDTALPPASAGGNGPMEDADG